MKEEVVAVIRHEQTLSSFELALKAKQKKLKTYARNSFYQVPGMQVEDMEQELLNVLYSAVQLYDPIKGRTFDTFLQMLWRNKIGSLKRAAGVKKRKAEIISLDVEAVQLAIDARRHDPSAEDEAMARETLREEWDSTPASLRSRLIG